MGGEVVSPTEFLLEELIVFWRKCTWQIVGDGREVLTEDESGLDKVAVFGEVIEKATQLEEIFAAGFGLARG
jgi:hypothetical protein